MVTLQFANGACLICCDLTHKCSYHSITCKQSTTLIESTKHWLSFKTTHDIDNRWANLNVIIGDEKNCVWEVAVVT